MDLKNKTVLTVGAGISGIGSVEALERAGARTILYDGNAGLSGEEIYKKLPAGSKAEVITGELPDKVREAAQLVVLSPGVPADTEFAGDFRRRGIKVIGEIELAYELGRGRLVAITGTNGKTTTTALTGEIMKNYYKSVYIVGNIGSPYTEIAQETKDETVTVAEISSFQLETIDSFHPDVSAILNITPDHLNRHHTMENYVALKERIAMNQNKENVCVLNYDNEYTRDFGGRCPARAVYFSSSGRLEEGLYLDGEDICIARGGHSERLMGIHDMRLAGVCNAENVMAAIAIAEAVGVPMDIILNTVRDFKAVEHRIEFVARKRGVDFYNDSKATNPDAAIQGIKAMSRPTVLIAGGYDKNSEYDEWIKAFDGKVKCLCLIGQTKEKIAKCAKKYGITNIILSDSFEQAFEKSVENAKDGDAVLLSPACASWGMFENYEARGNIFKEYVDNLK